MVPLLRPGIGEQDERPPNRPRRQRFDKEPRVVGEEPQIAQPAAVDLAKQFGGAGFEASGANKADFGMPRRLLGEMLAAAKTDLEPYVRDPGREQHLRVDPNGLRQRYCALRPPALQK